MLIFVVLEGVGVGVPPSKSVTFPPRSTIMNAVITSGALLILLVMWSSSRFDPLLHIILWLELGSLSTAYTRRMWSESDPFSWGIELAEELSLNVLDILPNSLAFVALISMVCNCLALGAMTHQKANRGAWLFYVLVRIALPLSAIETMSFLLASSSGNDASGGGRGEEDFLGRALYAASYVALAGLSLASRSWPMICFTLADFAYSFACFYLVKVNPLPTDSEVAFIATVLTLAHDVASIHFLPFLESAAFAAVTVFIAESALFVVGSAHGSEFLRSSPVNSRLIGEAFDFASASGTEVYVTRLPPLLLGAWSIGIHLRTYTQGRLKASELAACTAFALAAGGLLVGTERAGDRSLLLRHPLFFCVVSALAAVCCRISLLSSMDERVVVVIMY